MKSAGKARNNGLYRHIRTSKEIIRNLLNDSDNSSRKKGCEPNIHSILPSKSDSKMVSSGGKANSSLVVVISSKPRRQTSRITVSCSSDLIILQNMALSSFLRNLIKGVNLQCHQLHLFRAKL